MNKPAIAALIGSYLSGGQVQLTEIIYTARSRSNLLDLPEKCCESDFFRLQRSSFPHPSCQEIALSVIVIPNKNHQVDRSGSILLPISDQDGRTTEINWNDYSLTSFMRLPTSEILLREDIQCKITVTFS